MKQLNNNATWIVASLLAAASTFAQSICPAPQKRDPCQEAIMCQMTGNYNAPARIDVQNAWNFYATGSFTYWQPIQENMEVGVTENFTLDEISTGTLLLEGDWINMDFEYKPGFKIGLGMNTTFDDWDIYSEYTWFRGQMGMQSDAPENGFLVSNLGTPRLNGISALYDTASTKWRIHMDFADLEIARAYYVGTRLSFRPFFGARGAWIRQRLHSEYVCTVSGIFPIFPGTLSCTQVTQSWGVGPRAGLYSNWMLGSGFKVYGNGFVDLLYTRYTKLGYNEQFNEADSGEIRVFHTTQTNLSAVRTHLDLEIGIGWGSYFDNNNWHVNLAAGYGFQVFFDQNVFRRYADDRFVADSLNPTGNLYIQGLTTTAGLDF